MTPGDLTHFNWPRLLCDKPNTGFIRRPTIRWFTRAKIYATGKHGKYYIFVGIKYADELLYNRVGT